MSILVCIPTRDGNPHIDTVNAVNEACADYGDAVATIVRNRHTVCVSRNRGVAHLLKGIYSHILFVDDDTTIPVDTIKLLLECDSNVATGCVPTTIGGKAVLTVADCEDGLGYQWRQEWFDGIVTTPACGGACMLIRRDVFTRMGFPWFTSPEFHEDGKHTWFSDDIAFCKKVCEYGIGPIMAHGNVRCGHTKLVNVEDFITDLFSPSAPTLAAASAGV